jgi:hypothetical protein
MITSFKYTQYDTGPPLEADLQQQNPDTGAWEPLDVNGATVRLLAQNRRTRLQFGGDVEFVDVVPPTGQPAPTRVRYDFQTGDLGVPGDYVFQWEVIDAQGERRTIPAGDSWFEFAVARKLGSVAVSGTAAAGVDGTGPWIDGGVAADYAGLDLTGPWIDAAAGSLVAGVDGTGVWIEG